MNCFEIDLFGIFEKKGKHVMSSTINQEQSGASERLIVPKEDMERIMNMSIIPPIDDMLIAALDRNCANLWIPPVDEED